MIKQFFKKIIVTILTLEAKWILEKYHPKIVAVTGSVGKTSTKDAIATVLASQYTIRKSEKSFNSEIGIPLTILGLKNAWNNPVGWLQNIIEGLLPLVMPHPFPEILVLEVGADRPGDIKRVSEWVKPDIVVFTSMGTTPVHVEFFATIEDVFKEKSYLVRSLKQGGVLVYSSDDARVAEMAQAGGYTKIGFGLNAQSDVAISHSEILYNDIGLPEGERFRVDYNGKSVPVTLQGVVGVTQMLPVAAAIAVADAVRINIIQAIEAISGHVTPRGRMRLIPGIKHCMLIDDTYNASPVAVHGGLEALSRIEIKGKKIAVLADMMELGSFSGEEHYHVGEHVATVADVLVTVGIRSHKTVEGALAKGMSEKHIYQFEDSTIAGKFVQGLIEPNDIVYVKGSQSMRMERIVEEVMAEPDRAIDLLVRQEPEWKKR